MAKYGKLGIPYLNTLKSLALRNRVDLTPIKEIVKVTGGGQHQRAPAPEARLIRSADAPPAVGATPTDSPDAL